MRRYFVYFSGPTPLHVACRHGLYEIVQILVQFNAEIDPLDQDGNTPADLAHKISHSGIIKYLNEQKMERLMGGGDIPITAPPQHKRHATDGGLAARELDEECSFTPPMTTTATKAPSSPTHHARSTSTDLEMLLMAHRQLTVRESARDRTLSRIQDSVVNLQSGMHRMVCVFKIEKIEK